VLKDGEDCGMLFNGSTYVRSVLFPRLLAQNEALAHARRHDIVIPFHDHIVFVDIERAHVEAAEVIISVRRCRVKQRCVG
jgi:hypothetical protein